MGSMWCCRVCRRRAHQITTRPPLSAYASLPGEAEHPAAYRVEQWRRRQGGHRREAAGVVADQVAGQGAVRDKADDRVATTSGGLPLLSRVRKVPIIRSYALRHSSRPSGEKLSTLRRVSSPSLSPAAVRMLAGSTTTTWTSQGASSWRNDPASEATVALDAEVGPMKGMGMRSPIELAEPGGLAFQHRRHALSRVDHRGRHLGERPLLAAEEVAAQRRDAPAARMSGTASASERQRPVI